ncbi:hypothetical protein SDC9_94639 [bioreactor metagenome]|uniref:Uncharacterized protein n=1 Tax=bioreactor metagenome TaxID=1076179 RepID=A0A645A5E7_9ZZZZ
MGRPVSGMGRYAKAVGVNVPAGSWVLVAVLLGICVGVRVAVAVGVFVGTAVAVFVGVLVGVLVGVAVAVAVGDGVTEGVAVAGRPTTTVNSAYGFSISPVLLLSAALAMMVTVPAANGVTRPVSRSTVAMVGSLEYQ